MRNPVIAKSVSIRVPRFRIEKLHAEIDTKHKMNRNIKLERLPVSRDRLDSHVDLHALSCWLTHEWRVS